MTDDFFNKNYETDAAWAGVMFAMLSQLGYGIFETEAHIGKFQEYMTGIGFSLMTWVNEIVFGTITILWALSYIEKRKYSYAYFRAIQWLSPATWANCVVANIMVILGIFWGENPIYIIYPLVYDVFFFMFGSLIYYVTGPKMVRFYRWDERQWYEPYYEDNHWWELF